MYYHPYPGRAPRAISRQCSSAPAVPKQAEYWAPSAPQQASSSDSSLYDMIGYPVSAPLYPLDASYVGDDLRLLTEPLSSPFSDDFSNNDSGQSTQSQADIEYAVLDGSYSSHGFDGTNQSSPWSNNVPGQWDHCKHTVGDINCDYSEPSHQYIYDPEVGICAHSHGVAGSAYGMHCATPSALAGALDTHASAEALCGHCHTPQHPYSGCFPLTPLSAQSLWTTPIYQRQTIWPPTQNSLSSPVQTASNSTPDTIPLHQPRPTKRFDYNMLNDIAASLETASSGL